jgi:hypothetical protein
METKTIWRRRKKAIMAKMKEKRKSSASKTSKARKYGGEAKRKIIRMRYQKAKAKKNQPENQKKLVGLTAKMNNRRNSQNGNLAAKRGKLAMKSNGISGVAKAKANVSMAAVIGRGGQQNGGQNGGSRRKSSIMKNRKGEKPGEKKETRRSSVAAWRSEINYKGVSISA